MLANYHPGEELKRRWFPLWQIDMYVLREFIIKFFIIMLLASILFVTGDIFNDLEDFLGRDSEASTMGIIFYFLLRLPANIRFVLPISVLLGCMWTMATFGKNQEVTAMRAAGISLFRCGGSILAAGLAVTAINYYLNETFVPYAERRSLTLKMELTRGSDSMHRNQRFLIYTSPDMKRLWLFEIIDNAREFNSVYLKLREQDANGRMRVTEEWHAQKVTYSPSEGWVFYNVQRRVTAKNAAGISRAPVFCERLTIEATETPVEILDSLKDIEELPVWALWRILSKTDNMPEALRQSFLTVLCYRLTFPLACFLAAFLGIPLATRNERSGIMLAIATAVGVIIGYVVIAQVFMVLGRRGVLNAYFAGAAPTIAFIAYGAWRIARQKV